jgi:hypothetical protein
LGDPLAREIGRLLTEDPGNQRMEALLAVLDECLPSGEDLVERGGKSE